MSRIPHRIVCLSAEAADWLWRVGAWKNVAGVTAYFSQPNDAPPKPRVSGFSSANLDQITRLNPDLIITFSDVQTQLAAALIQRGFSVLATNQRTLAEIETTLALLARGLISFTHTVSDECLSFRLPALALSSFGQIQWLPTLDAQQ